jgi:Zn-dependent protease with chaperone function
VSADALSRTAGPPPGLASVALFYVLYSAFTVLWSLPVGLAGLAVERRFGFSTESIAMFGQDAFLGLAIGWVMIPVVWLGYRIYARWPRSWWLILWVVIVPASFVVTIVYPVAVAPLYNHYTPLAPGPLRTGILELADRAGIRNARVVVENTSVRTNHVNAYVTGIGPTTRIVVNDTALRLLPNDQILAMIGHEMGHYVEHHVLVGAAAGAVGAGLILYMLALILPAVVARFGPACRLRGLDDLAALPLVMLTISILGLFGAPLGNAVSRTMERRADAYGLRLTGLNDATARLMVGFAERDLGDPDPPPLLHFWFGTHPTLSERIDFALRYRRGGH